MQIAVREGLSADDGSAVGVLDALYREAVRCGASDIHFERTPDGGRIRLRVDGVLREHHTLPGRLFDRVVMRIKVLAGMDVADRRQPQDGSHPILVEERSLDARVSTLPTVCGEKVVVRLVRTSATVPSLEELGMHGDVLRRFRQAVEAPHGCAVVCGPTGSGKTTTLYAAMALRNRTGANLCSVEDPVEIRMPGVNQVQIHPRAGVTFAATLRSLLRQDPNVIMVGEMRDAETAAVACSAALSGQTVLTTLHASDAVAAVDRLSDLGLEGRVIASAVEVIVAQRLLRRLCRDCRDARGTCTTCGGCGYSGRIGVFEALHIGDAVRESIIGGEPLHRRRIAAREHGLVPMREAAAMLCSLRITDDAEVERVFGP